MADESKKISQLPELNLDAMSDVTLVGNGLTAVGASVATGKVSTENLVGRYLQLREVSDFEETSDSGAYMVCVENMGASAPSDRNIVCFSSGDVISHYLDRMLVWGLGGEDEPGQYDNLNRHIFSKVLGTNYGGDISDGCFDNIPYISISTYAEEAVGDDSILYHYPKTELIAKGYDDGYAYIGAADGRDLIKEYLCHGGSGQKVHYQLYTKPWNWDRTYNYYFVKDGDGYYVENTEPDWHTAGEVGDIYAYGVITDLGVENGHDSHCLSYPALDNRILSLVFGPAIVGTLDEDMEYETNGIYNTYMSSYFGYLDVSAIPSSPTPTNPTPTLVCTGLKTMYTSVGISYIEPYVSQMTLDDLVSYVRAHL